MKNIEKPKVPSENKGEFFTTKNGCKLFVYDFQPKEDYKKTIFVISESQMSPTPQCSANCQYRVRSGRRIKLSVRSNLYRTGNGRLPSSIQTGDQGGYFGKGSQGVVEMCAARVTT